MLGVSEEELQRDKERLMNFIKENPFPDYDFVTNDLILKKLCDIEQYSEYGKINHDLMKEIYENIFDEKLIRKNGESIYERGDIRALQNNYNTLFNVLGFLIKKRSNLNRDTIILIFYTIKDIVSHAWNGIGEWRY